MNSNFETFEETLAAHYRIVRDEPEYAMAFRKQTPDSLAALMTDGLKRGKADKDGKCVQATLAALGIKDTYKAIREYLATA